MTWRVTSAHICFILESGSIFVTPLRSAFRGGLATGAVSGASVLSHTTVAMLLRGWLLLFGLAGSCCGGLGDFAPPTINISLDQDPELRWEPLSQYFDTEYLKNASADVIE